VFGRVLTPSLGVRGVAGLRVIEVSAILSVPASSRFLSTVYLLAALSEEKLVEGNDPCGSVLGDEGGECEGERFVPCAGGKGQKRRPCGA